MTRGWLALVPLVMGSLLCGCATQSASLVDQPFPADAPRMVRIERCEDRTGTSERGERNLQAEATQALTDKVQSSGLFTIAPDAPMVLTCDIERFAEGSAFKRWLAPGWGSTLAGVTVTVWQKPGDRMLASFRAESSVKAGGLYTIGADQYIFKAAFDDIMDQMKRWVAGERPGGTPR